MAYYIFLIIVCAFASVGLLTVGGYSFYKRKNLKSLEQGIAHFEYWIVEGIKKIGSALFWWVMEETGHMKPEKIIDQRLYLTNEELNDLKHWLGEKVFEVPVLESYLQESDCLFFSFTAVGLKAKYQDIEHEQFLRLIEHSVQSYYLDTRQQKVFIKVFIATPTRVQFAIPLSGLGFKYLDSQEQMQTLLLDATSSDEEEPLEEVFHIFDDEDEP